MAILTWCSLVTRLLVGSKPRQPWVGVKASTQAWEAPAPRSGLPVPPSPGDPRAGPLDWLWLCDWDGDWLPERALCAWPLGTM